MTNNERFNQLLNNCKNPRTMYNALMELAGVGIEQRDLRICMSGPKKGKITPYDTD